jgi:hypothetical protein
LHPPRPCCPHPKEVEDDPLEEDQADEEDQCEEALAEGTAAARSPAAKKGRKGRGSKAGSSKAAAHAAPAASKARREVEWVGAARTVDGDTRQFYASALVGDTKVTAGSVVLLEPEGGCPADASPTEQHATYVLGLVTCMWQADDVEDEDDDQLAQVRACVGVTLAVGPGMCASSGWMQAADLWCRACYAAIAGPPAGARL